MPNKKFEVITFLRLLLFSFVIIGYASIIYLVATGHFTHLFFALLFSVFISQIGILFTFHRVVSHKAAMLPFWIKQTFIFLGGLAFQGSVVSWAATHRQHHAYQDTSKDPHSPKFYGTIYTQLIGYSFNKIDPRFTITFLKQKDLKFWHDNYLKIYLPLLILPFLLFTFETAITITFAPIAFSFLLISLVNTLGHSGKDGIPKNSILLGIFVWGDGYHKNHHERPASIRLGKWDPIGILGSFLNAKTQNEKI